MKTKLTETEWELISTIRNCKKTYPVEQSWNSI